MPIKAPFYKYRTNIPPKLCYARSMYVRSTSITLFVNIGLVRVKDEDEDGHQKVECSIDAEGISLEEIEDSTGNDVAKRPSLAQAAVQKFYRLLSARPFDRDVQARIEGRIRCKDNGVPSLVSDIPVLILIKVVFHFLLIGVF